MRNTLFLALCCLLVPVGVLLLPAGDVSAVAGKTANLARLEQDAKTGVWRAWIQIDAKHATIAKFKQAPTEADVKAIRDKTLAQEAEAKTAAAAATATAVQSETWKAEGKCPTCGQPLPKEK